MGKKFQGVIIKQIASKRPRNISATARYMADLVHDGHKIPADSDGKPMSGFLNCFSKNRSGQLKEINRYLRLHKNLKSAQAASHQILSYPEGFIPTREQVVRDLRILLKKYGMDDHPLVWDCHSNTDNFHVHFLLCRVQLEPNENGEYPIANAGLIQKKCIEKDDAGKILRERMLTDWASCRQAAISEIGEAYGWGTPRNVRMTSDGKPLDRVDPKDPLGDKTRAGERKTGKKSKERQLAEVIKTVFDIAIAEEAVSKGSFWHAAYREFSSRAIDMKFKPKGGKQAGGYVIGPGNRGCSFGNAGKEYTFPALIKRFGPPSPDDAAHHSEYDFEPFEYQLNDLTVEEAKKRLLPVFREAVDAGTWPYLIEGIEHLGMRPARSGGGLVILYNDGRDTIKASDISNKYSLSKLKKVLGPCPLPKSASAKPSPRGTLIQDALAIIAPNVRRAHGLFHIHPELQRVGIQIERKTFPKPNGERGRSYVLTLDGISIWFSDLGRDADGYAYTMSRLKNLDRHAPTAQQAAWFAHVEAQAEISRQRREAAHRAKEQEIGNITFLTAIAKFIKLNPNQSEASHVRPGS